LLVSGRLSQKYGFVPKPVGADRKRKGATPNQVFGRAVTEKRLSQALSQATLAASLGYSNYYLGKIERGEANVTCDVMSAVSGYFGLSIGQFWLYAERLSGQASRQKRQ
jgi:transcriptional regulator with XRE-family HTH domain